MELWRWWWAAPPAETNKAPKKASFRNLNSPKLEWMEWSEKGSYPLTFFSFEQKIVCLFGAHKSTNDGHARQRERKRERDWKWMVLKGSKRNKIKRKREVVDVKIIVVKWGQIRVVANDDGKNRKKEVLLFFSIFTSKRFNSMMIRHSHLHCRVRSTAAAADKIKEEKENQLSGSVFRTEKKEKEEETTNCWHSSW